MGTHTTDAGLNNGDGRIGGSDGWLMVSVMVVPGGVSWWGGVMVTVQSGGRRQAVGPHPLPPPRRRTPQPEGLAVLPGLANAPREAALEDRGFAVEGLAEFWAAAAAAAKVARFCNCRALIPGERSQRGWCQTWGARLRRGPDCHQRLDRARTRGGVCCGCAAGSDPGVFQLCLQQSPTYVWRSV